MLKNCFNYYPFGLGYHEFYNDADNRNETEAKRYGFNGKERDISFGNVHYDYGFRIYNPSLGKFLSVDPLAPDYPELTPYQFASNSPISGIDLDGLEFLDANEALFEVKYGRLQHKIENYGFITRSTYNLANMNPKNWKPGEIGVNTTVYTKEQLLSLIKGGEGVPYKGLEINPEIGQFKKTIFSRTDEPSKLETNISVPLTSKGEPDRRYNLTRNNPRGTYPHTSVIGTARTQAGGRAVGAAYILALAFENYALYSLTNEKSTFEEQMKEVLPNAIDMLINSEELIPSQYLNDKDVLDILNVIIQGESNSDNEDIFKIGTDILKANGKLNDSSREKLKKKDSNCVGCGVER